ncbi:MULTISPECIES: NADP-dependent oxidoreductase [Streptomyces]|uniref:NADP-dependent oxidoreductase n=1 Tax=Streptomyces eurythermus TaxID=42237 RepID=A0ABW6Z4Y8_9ACTN|nr:MULTISPECIES: NADP-dependent oxidoreductase [Streptomyces]QIS74072.1 NADP-dependent oxidoreductase [Streptomyces sp. DSM 40868]WDM13183.1 NADP-dependent oxidoreductase [Streptomyces lavenduligriseus]
MRAVVVRNPGGPEALEIVRVPEPVPGPGQVRVRVRAAAVNPVDAAVREGKLAEVGLMARHSVVGIGADIAGEVDEVGPGVGGLEAGQAVVALRERFDGPYGAYADYVVLDASAVAPAPAGMSPTVAATLPLNALTAQQALARLSLQPGRTLLVTGAAGAVGGYATELASLAGVHVVAVAGQQDEELIRSLGARSFIARTDDVARAARALVPGGVDAVLDAAVQGIQVLDAVRNQGAFASVLAGAAPFAMRGIRVTELQWVEADGRTLDGLATLAGAGRLTPRVADVLPLTEAVEAHRRLAKGGLRGRLVLVP